MKTNAHAVSIAGGGEYTLCGVAFDAYASGDAEEPIDMAAPGELVKCKECRAMIDWARSFKGYRAPSEK